jgi:hypothetical protein
MAWDGRGLPTQLRAIAKPDDLLKTFATAWYGPLNSNHGATPGSVKETETRLGRTLPAAFREWHTLAGRHHRLISANRDHLVTLEQLSIEDGFLIFLRENQGVWELAIAERDLQNNDPPVIYLEPDTPESKNQLNSSFSLFSFQWALYSAVWTGPYWASANTSNVDLDPLLSSLVALPLPSWPLFGATLEFFAGADIVLHTESKGSTGLREFVRVGARTKEVLTHAMSLCRCDWDSNEDQVYIR